MWLFVYYIPAHCHFFNLFQWKLGVALSWSQILGGGASKIHSAHQKLICLRNLIKTHTKKEPSIVFPSHFYPFHKINCSFSHPQAITSKLSIKFSRNEIFSHPANKLRKKIGKSNYLLIKKYNKKEN